MSTSTARQLLQHLWDHGSHKSCQRINFTMREGLRLAISSHLNFSSDDFTYFANAFRWRYWVGADTEWIYSLAVTDENNSCVKAWESHIKRKPFLANGVSACSHGGFLHANFIERGRERMAQGFRVKIDANFWYVTGFSDSGEKVKLAKYKGFHREGKPEKLMALTHQEALEIFPAPKNAKKAS